MSRVHGQIPKCCQKNEVIHIDRLVVVYPLLADALLKRKNLERYKVTKSDWSSWKGLHWLLPGNVFHVGNRQISIWKVDWRPREPTQPRNESIYVHIIWVHEQLGKCAKTYYKVHWAGHVDKSPDIIPEAIKSSHKNVTIAIDIMFMNWNAFFIISRHIKI